MDQIAARLGLVITPLKVIPNPKGDIYHALKRSESSFKGFGEAYFSSVYKNEIKGWNRHKTMTLNLIVPSGEVTFVIFQEPSSSVQKEMFYCTTLSIKNYKRLTVPPGLWVAFRGEGEGLNLILNLADMEHDPEEKETQGLSGILFDWDSI
jgi:dTDP-4-dehydrorhamnose 3,5-epimerase